MIDKTNLDKHDLEALETAYEYASELEESLFLTIQAAVKAANEDNHSLHELRVARAESREMWRSLVEKVFLHAVKD